MTLNRRQRALSRGLFGESRRLGNQRGCGLLSLATLVALALGRR